MGAVQRRQIRDLPVTPNGQYKRVGDLPVTPNGQYKRGLTGRHAEQAESEDIVTKGTTLISIWVACTSSSDVELQ